MEKRNLTPLRNVLVRYLAVCGGVSLVILLVWWGQIGRASCRERV